MGLLDDAIREHLELKRRHGADPSEVARQEQEALGPARRGPEPLEVQTPEPGPEAGHEDQPPYEAPRAPEPAPAPEPAAPPVDEVVERAPERRAPEPEPEPEPAPHVPEPDPEPEPAPPRASIVEQPTVAFDAADLEEAQRRPDPEPVRERRAERESQRRREPEPERRSAAPAADEEDVLEETPDFLQETPEHDRLWFEQRPPRDFDFDG